MPRILITGSREISQRDTVAKALASAWVGLGSHPDTVVCHGDARGADRLSGAVARDNPGRLVEERHPANWRPNGVDLDRGAGHKRNQEMVSAGADICLAFFKVGAGNRGTQDCVKKAEKAGIPVIVTWEQ